MSQIVTRNSAVAEEKDKPRDSPAKDTKKKMAATEKESEKAGEKSDKSVDKKEHPDKHDNETDKSTDKKADKKSDTQTEKTKEDSNKGEKSVKEKKEKEADKKPLENGAELKENGREVVENGTELIGNGEEVLENDKEVVENGNDVNKNGTTHNGISDVTLNNGRRDDVLNGLVSEDSSDDGDEMMVIDDHDQDELFPELTYDDTSDVECFESPTPENLPSRSFTRRSQAKVTRTPETPRPAVEKQPEKDGNTDDPKDGKVQKLKEELPVTDRKLRSADSPRPGDKKTLDKPHESKKLKEKTPEPTKKTPEPPKKLQDSPKKTQDSPKKVPGSPKKVPGSPKKAAESPTKVRDGSKDREPESKLQEEKENGVKEIEVEVEIVVDSDGSQDEPRKLDTNYSKSRVKVSPYRRSMRLADQTTSSVMANYTGNNTTMEMDITETSSYVSITEEPSVDESPYLSGLRNIRGRRSYKPLKEMTLRHVMVNKSARSANVSVPEIPSRPTGTVVGRKRKPDGEEEPVEKVDLTTESDDLASVVRSKRMRLLDKISHPFKRTLASTPIQRRAAEIVGINTDLPLTAPVDPEPFDPESLKPATDVTSKTTELPQTTEKDSKRCIVM